jgi:hypothetical protein
VNLTVQLLVMLSLKMHGATCFFFHASSNCGAFNETELFLRSYVNGASGDAVDAMRHKTRGRSRVLFPV